MLTSRFLPLQDAGAPRASVGGPLDGQKVKLYPSPLSSLPLYLPSVLPFVSVFTAVW